MNKIIFYFLPFLLLVNSCGYQPIYTNKNINFSIKEINSINNNRLITLLKNNLNMYSDTENKDKNYSLNVEVERKIITTSKDTAGNPKTYLMELIAKIEIQKNYDEITKKNFVEKFNYNTQENKFNQSQYEENIEENLIRKISENIILYLSTI
jgi:nitrogenase subunit NifH|tara:strand:- start:30 stop:488 length:459 start_codon:yes stop_codon:yes gene_type:complete